MFSNSLYFKHISCPYFKFGNCEKPTCQFKHDLSKRVLPDVKVVGKVVDSHKSASSTTDHSHALPSVPVYRPTPISELKRNQDSQIQKSTKYGDSVENAGNTEYSSLSSTSDYKRTDQTSRDTVQTESVALLNVYMAQKRTCGDAVEFDPKKAKYDYSDFIDAAFSLQDDTPSDEVVSYSDTQPEAEFSDGDGDIPQHLNSSPNKIPCDSVDIKAGKKKSENCPNISTKKKADKRSVTSCDKIKTQSSSSGSKSHKEKTVSTSDEPKSQHSTKTSSVTKSHNSSSSKSHKGHSKHKVGVGHSRHRSTSERSSSSKSASKSRSSHSLSSQKKESALENDNNEKPKIKVEIKAEPLEVDEFDGCDLPATTSNLDDLNYLDSAINFNDDCPSETEMYDECLKIFNSYTKDDCLNCEKKKDVTMEDIPEALSVSKKRTAHREDQPILRKVPVPQPRRPTPQQLLVERLKAQESISKVAKPVVSVPEVAALPLSGSTGRSRLAHTPNPVAVSDVLSKSTNKSALAPESRAQKMLKERYAKMGIQPKEATAAHTVAKGQTRKAHTINMATVKKCLIADFGKKVPTNTRQNYLNVYYGEFLKLCETDTDACEKALDYEKQVYNKSSNKAVYLNVAVNAVKKLRDDIGQMLGGEKGVSPTKTNHPSHESVLGGKKATQCSFSIERRPKQDSNPEGAELYNGLLKYVLRIDQQVENEYPRPHPTEKNKAVVQRSKEAWKGKDESERLCVRCGKVFRVCSITFTPIFKEQCLFHYGSLWKMRNKGAIESRYSCCQGDTNSSECAIATQHVINEEPSSPLTGYVSTHSKRIPLSGSYGVYALDCEMCYTTRGNELTRITVIDSTLKTVYEALVKPSNPVVDYNTRFSGMTADDLSNVTTTIQQVQAVLLNMFSEKTILIGHSLDSDLRALKMFHNTVVDTAIVFPHRRGPPFKRALRTLMAEYIKKIIQNDVNGHDSAEDAKACMELMLWKLKYDRSVSS